MKKLLALVLAAVLLKWSGMVPFEPSDVADILLLEAILVTMEEETVKIRADGAEGSGSNWKEAMEDLRHGAEGNILPGMIREIILADSAFSVLPQIVRDEQLRPAAAVYVCPGQMPEPKEAASYLAVHRGKVTISQMQAAVENGEGIRLPILMKTEGGLRLYDGTNG